jgi:hypothetical protein
VRSPKGVNFEAQRNSLTNETAKQAAFTSKVLVFHTFLLLLLTLNSPLLRMNNKKYWVNQDRTEKIGLFQ